MLYRLTLGVMFVGVWKMCRRYMCRRNVCVIGVVVKMLGIELHDRRGKLFGMLCLYVYSYRIVTSHTYRIHICVNTVMFVSSL